MHGNVFAIHVTTISRNVNKTLFNSNDQGCTQGLAHDRYRTNKKHGGVGCELACNGHAAALFLRQAAFQRDPNPSVGQCRQVGQAHHLHEREVIKVAIMAMMVIEQS